MPKEQYRSCFTELKESTKIEVEFVTLAASQLKNFSKVACYQEMWLWD